jgi:CelD/BcsL family acetyltransferase involved in cellulose biosynthesis
MSLRTEILSSDDEIARIAPAWDALAAEFGSPINSSLWCRHALRHAHGPVDKPHVVVVWNGDQLSGIAPLIVANRKGGRRIEIIGTKTLYEPVTVLAKSEVVAQALVNAVVALKLPVTLTRLAESEFNNVFLQAARRGGLVVCPAASGSPFVDLSVGWDSYYQGLPSRLKNVIRRGNKQLAKLAKTEFEFIKPDARNVTASLQTAFEVEQRSWKGKAGSAVLLRPDLRGFFFSYAAELAERGGLLVSFLRLDGAPIAMQVANISHGAYWQLKIGYDEQYAKQLAGLQLQLETIKWTAERGYRRYEFLGSAEPWIREWTGGVHSYTTMLFYPWNPAGLGALLVDNAARVRGKLARYWQRGS